jgi:hypothetical protein
VRGLPWPPGTASENARMRLREEARRHARLTARAAELGIRLRLRPGSKMRDRDLEALARSMDAEIARRTREPKPAARALTRDEHALLFPAHRPGCGCAVRES